MKVIINLEVETPDYEGKEFMKEINKLLVNIRKDTGDNDDSLCLLKFRMYGKHENLSDNRNFEWQKQA